MRTTATLTILCALIPVLSFAQESVCLKTGFCLDAESHVLADGMIVVQSSGGSLQFPADQVDGITARPAAARVEPSAERRVEPGGSADLLIRAALREGLEPEFVRSVAMIESGLRQEAVSPKGALGLMQLMPMTAQQLGVDPRQSDQNALGGAVFLRQLLIKYNGNSALALAAYNSGPGSVDKYQGIPPYPETRRYVVRVLEEYARQQRIQNLNAKKSLPEASSESHVETLGAKSSVTVADGLTLAQR